MTALGGKAREGPAVLRLNSLWNEPKTTHRMSGCFPKIKLAGEFAHFAMIFTLHARFMFQQTNFFDLCLNFAFEGWGRLGENFSH